MHDYGDKTVRSNNPSVRDVATTERVNIENGEEKNQVGHCPSEHTGEGVGRRHLPSNAEILRGRSGEGRGQTASRLVQERSAEYAEVIEPRYGTKKSGNYGHQGRPDEVGGSGGGGNEPSTAPRHGSGYRIQGVDQVDFALLELLDCVLDCLNRKEHLQNLFASAVVHGIPFMIAAKEWEHPAPRSCLS